MDKIDRAKTAFVLKLNLSRKVSDSLFVGDVILLLKSLKIHETN